jgi:hypothetical protein
LDLDSGLWQQIRHQSDRDRVRSIPCSLDFL